MRHQDSTTAPRPGPRPFSMELARKARDLPAVVRASDGVAPPAFLTDPDAPPPFSGAWVEARIDGYARPTSLPARAHPRLGELTDDLLGSFVSGVLCRASILLTRPQARMLLVDLSLLDDLLDTGRADEWLLDQAFERLAVTLLGCSAADVPPHKIEMFFLALFAAARASGYRLAATAEDALETFLEDRMFA